jgi:hypothetical protein
MMEFAMNPPRFLLFLLLILIAPAAVAQTADPAPTPAIEQNEAFRDTLVKMRIAREESEHKKLVEKAAQLNANVSELSKLASSGRLPKSSDRKLKDIEKAARQIRSDAGGGDDTNEAKDVKAPASLDEALSKLDGTSQELKDSMGKTSRHVVSLKVIDNSNEIIRLVKVLRAYMD